MESAALAPISSDSVRARLRDPTRNTRNISLAASWTEEGIGNILEIF